MCRAVWSKLEMQVQQQQQQDRASAGPVSGPPFNAAWAPGRWVSRALGLAGLVVLTACGGGSDTSTPTPPVETTTFSFRGPFTQLISQGFQTDFTVTGSCNGTGQFASGVPALVTFESQSTYGVAQTLTRQFDDCSPTTYAATTSVFGDAQYNPVGSLLPGVWYAVKTQVATLPDTVEAGNTARWAVHTVYADSTKAKVTGLRDYSWEIKPDTSSTVVANFIVRSYDATSTLTLTEQFRYLLDATGKMSLQSIDQQYNDTALTHYVYTAN